MEGGEHFNVRQIAPHDSDWIAALHLALGARPTPAGRTAEPVADLLADAARRSVSIDLLFGAYHNDTLVSSALAVESPGAAAMVFVPFRRASESVSRATREVLEYLKHSAGKRSIRLLEALVAPGSACAAEILERTGFRRLTQLIYLSRLTLKPSPSLDIPRDLEWTQFEPDLTQLFCAALEATYVQSLDCPELTGLRSTVEVLTGHRAAGVFDPRLWWVVRRGAEPVGVLLLNRISSQPAVEIVYLGVAQPARGTGVANALLERAVTAAHEIDAKQLALAVDIRNSHARRMYARWSFVQTMARDVFVASPCQT